MSNTPFPVRHAIQNYSTVHGFFLICSTAKQIFNNKKKSSNLNFNIFTLFVPVINGPDILDEHCVIENNNGFVLLNPFPDSVCLVNSFLVNKKVRLKQGKYDYLN